MGKKIAMLLACLAVGIPVGAVSPKPAPFTAISEAVFGEGGPTAAASAAVTPNGLVVLLTDYGADSIYVGTLKGAIYAKSPTVRIETLTNSVPPYDILVGAHLLAEGSKEFPSGTTFCCVVDPGVGTGRKAIVLETKNGQFFVGPDNGLLSLVARRDEIASLREAANKALWRQGPLSHTFQGRDIFGPVAAAVASGVPLSEVGPEIKDIVRLQNEESRIEGGIVHGKVVRTDDYGNIVTNIAAEDLERIGLKPNDTAEIMIGKARFVAPRKSTYSDVPKGERVLLVQSSGLVECAINLGTLAGAIGEGVHADVTVKKAP
jgi:hypothetical protein